MYYLNVWLTVKNPSDVATVRDLLTQCATLSREEPGCVRFEAYHSETDERRFLLCEQWESKGAWETHRQARAVQEIYLPKVLPLAEREAHVCQRLG